jgi:hypothetical protein
MERVKLVGVGNIIRFNWHFYVLAVVVILLLLVGSNFLSSYVAYVAQIVATLVLISMLISLSVSAYVYDFSDLYSFHWLNTNGVVPRKQLVNIHAGFDETSHLLAKIYPTATLAVFDFYNPNKHTEISIERARKAYPPFPGTVKISTDQIPLAEKSAETILLTLAAHEIRNHDERTEFLKNLGKALQADGQLVVTEHLRDLNNFLAFNIGFMHFHSRKTWVKNFKEAGLKVISESKHTPFISVFILQPNGTAS